MPALTSPIDTTELADSCTVWLDAADMTTMTLLSTGENPIGADGEPVGYWRNKAPESTLSTYLGLSSFINSPGPFAGTSRPTYRTNILDLPVLYFDGGDYLTCRSDTITYPQQTVFVVANVNNNGVRIYTQAQTGFNDNFTAVSYIPSYASTTTSIGSLVNNTFQSPTNFRGSSVFDVFTSVHSGTVITNFANGVQTTSPFSNSLNIPFNVFRVGAGISSTLATNGTTFIGYIAEVIVYNRALTNTERAQVEMYLGTKWKLPRHIYAVQSGDWSDSNTWVAGNLPVSADHVYSNSYNININQDVLVQSLRNHAFNPNIASGGTFNITQPVSVATLSSIGFYINNTTPFLSSSNVNSGTIALTGHLRGGSVDNCIGYSHLSNADLSLSGLVVGGFATNCAGLEVVGEISNINITGSILGGASTACHGARLSGNTFQNITIEGSIAGGTGNSCGALRVQGEVSNLNIQGGVTGGNVSETSEGVFLTNARNIVLSGNVVGRSSRGMVLSAMSTCTLTLTGNVTGGTSSGSHGLEYDGVGDFNINGANVVNRLPSNFAGGTGLSACGLFFDGEGNLSLSGTATGGSGLSAHGFFQQNKNSNLYFQGLSGGSGSGSTGASILSGSGDITIDGNVVAGTGVNSTGCFSTRLCNVTVNNGTIRGSNSNTVVRGRAMWFTTWGGYGQPYQGPLFHPITTYNLNNVTIIGGSGNADAYGVVVDVGHKANITGSITGGTFAGLYMAQDTNVKLIGTATGGTASGIENVEGNLHVIGSVNGGTVGSGSGINSQGGITYVEGTVNGGASPVMTSTGITHSINQTQTPTTTIRGNVVGGSSVGSYGVTHNTAGILQVFGNVIANQTTGTNAIASGDPVNTINQYIYNIPNLTENSGSNVSNVQTGRGYLSKNHICGNVIDAPNGGTAIWAFQYNYEPAPKNVVVTYSTELDQQISMHTTDSLSAFSMPPVSAVREGVRFANNTLIGTCIIPDPKSVKYRMPVDNTEGYAILEPVDFFNVSVAKLSAQGTLGDRLRRSLTTQAAGEVFASWDKPQTYIPPNQFSGLQLWLDASDSSTLYDDVVGGNQVSLHDGLVARWEDKSGNGRHATQSLNSARPLLKLAAKNNANALKFDGINDFFDANGAASFFSESHTIFAVAQTSVGGRDNATERFQTIIAAQGFHQTISFQGYPNSTGIRAEIWNSTDSETKQSNVSYNQGNWCIATKRVNGTGFPSVQLFANGIAGPVQQLTTFPLRTSANVRIGAANSVSPYAWFLNGHVCEIIIYNSMLSLDDIKLIESYLKNKWAIY